MASFLVTGSTRGLGLSIVTVLVAKPVEEVAVVFASGRKRSAALDVLIKENPARIRFVHLDVSKPDTIGDAVTAVTDVVGDVGLNYLINSAGIMNYSEGGIAKMTDLAETIQVNVDGIHAVTSAFLPLLSKGSRKVVANLSSALGCISWADRYMFQSSPAYKISKAAVNMMTALYAQEYIKEGIIFIAISPGWCQTDMGTAAADLTAETGARATLDVAQNATVDDSGKLLSIKVEGWQPGLNDYDGKPMPW